MPAALLLAFLLPLCAASAAYAYGFSTPTTVQDDSIGQDCPGPNCDQVMAGVGYDQDEVCPGTGFTTRIVTCIRENILTATDDFLLPFASDLATLDTAACLLAIALWGLLIISGKRHALTHDGYVLGIKLLLISMAAANFSNWFSMALDAEDWMLGVVSSYAVNFSNLVNNTACVVTGGDSAIAVWNTVDCALQTLVGGIYYTATGQSTLGYGVLGFFFACLLSGSLGMLIALLGAYLIGCFLITIARALYVFLSAYIGMAVMFIILPLILPTVLFRVTKPYFDKWLRLTLTFMVQPLVLFAYLSMLVAAFDVVVYTGPNSLYHAIAGSEVDTIQNFEMGAWLQDGAYSQDEIGGVGIPLDPGAVQRKLDAPVPVNQGTLGVAAEVAGAQSMDWTDGIFHALGIGDSGVASALFDEPNLPITTVDWAGLADNQNLCIWKIDPGSGAPYCDATNYIVDLLLSLFMAVVTAYLLLKLLDFIPYIGAGLAGIPIGMPVFGVANAGGADMSAPGSGLLGQLKGKLAGQFQRSMQSKAKSRPPIAGAGGG